MNKGIIKILIFLAFEVFAVACGIATKVDNLGSVRDPKSEDCVIKFYKDEQPAESYKAVGKIESHIKRNFFLGGKVRLEDEAYKELRQKACRLGGDAVLIDDCIESAVSEMTHVHVWATVIQFNRYTFPEK